MYYITILFSYLKISFFLTYLGIGIEEVRIWPVAPFS